MTNKIWNYGQENGLDRRLVLSGFTFIEDKSITVFLKEELLSPTGIVVSIQSECILNNFYAKTGNARCLDYSGLAEINNGTLKNNSSTFQTIYCFNFTKLDGIKAINTSSGGTIQTYNDISTRAGDILNCTFISADYNGYIRAVSSAKTLIFNCLFKSLLNTSSGIACYVESPSSNIQISNSHFIVVNTGANVISAIVPATIKSYGNTHNEVASTPINANVTITALASF